MAPRTPNEIARDTVKLLTERKLAPTPENYQSIYHEIAGTKPLKPFPLDSLRQLVQALPANSPGQTRLKTQAEAAVSMHNWDNLQKALVGYASLGAPPTNLPFTSLGGGPAATTPQSLPEVATVFPASILEQMARIVDHALPAVGNDDEKLVEQAKELVRYLRLSEQEPAALRKMMANFAFRLAFVAEEQSVIKTTLLNLLKLVFENIAELSLDNPWLKGQMEALMDVTTPPLSVKRMEDLQARLKDVILKQSLAKQRTIEAQDEVKRSLSEFIERLVRMTQDSDQYTERFTGYMTRLEQANDLSDIAPVLQEAIQSTRAMATETQRTREELTTLRDRTVSAEAEITRLQEELERLSTQTRHDLLTGALNRKGLDEAVERELSRAQRSNLPVCVAMLDIDNFKKINDTHGHETGDAALVHLAGVARENLRPQDSLARYGGEEFVIVMPDANLEQGVESMKRVQRELTKRIFMQDTEHLLITFSAGVAQWQATETGADTIKRADQAMYLAKRAGKNRVVGA